MREFLSITYEYIWVFIVSIVSDYPSRLQIQPY